jgi:hypothetical protein
MVGTLGAVRWWTGVGIARQPYYLDNCRNGFTTNPSFWPHAGRGVRVLVEGETQSSRDSHRSSPINAPRRAGFRHNHFRQQRQLRL